MPTGTPPTENTPEPTPMGAIFDVTPSVKKKTILKQINGYLGILQDQFVIKEITLSKTSWTANGDEATYSNYKQSATIDLEENDFVMVDSDGTDEDLMSEYNVYATMGDVTADTDGDGSEQVSTLVFYADSVPTKDITVGLIVFSYSDGEYTRTESTLESRIETLEEQMDI